MGLFYFTEVARQDIITDAGKDHGHISQNMEDYIMPETDGRECQPKVILTYLRNQILFYLQLWRSQNCTKSLIQVI